MALDEIITRLQNEFKKPWVRDFEDIIEVDQTNHINIQRLKRILLNLPSNEAISLDSSFFPEADSRKVRKYGIPIKLKRYKTKKEAIKDKAISFRLYDKALEKAKGKEKTYVGFSWRGISRGESKNKNFLVTSLVQGYMLYSIIKQIKTGLYFKLSKLQTSDHERRMISNQIKQLNGYMPKGLDRVADIVIDKGGKISGTLPSKDYNYRINNKSYNIVIENLPIAYSARDKKCYAVWFDLTSRHMSDEKRFFISYIRPREEWFDSYDIALMFLAFDNNFNEWKNRNFHNDPYIVFNPFPFPSSELTKLERKLRKNTFKNISGKHKVLTKIDEEVLLMKFLISGTRLYG